MEMRRGAYFGVGALLVLLGAVAIIGAGMRIIDETPLALAIRSQPSPTVNLAMPAMVETLPPATVLADLYPVAASVPVFSWTDTDASGSSVTDSGIDGGSVIAFSGGTVSINGLQVGSTPVPVSGPVRIEGGTVTVTVTSTEVASGYVDGGATVGDGDNIASITLKNGVTVLSEGWTAWSDDGATVTTGRRDVDVSGSGNAVITAGTTTISDLNDGGDTCRASGVIGRANVDVSGDDHQKWGGYSGKTAIVRTSGVLAFTVLDAPDTPVQAELQVNAGGASLAVLPLPTTYADSDGRFLLSLASGSREQLGNYLDDHDNDPMTDPIDTTPALREMTLTADLTGLDRETCAGVTGLRWETTALGEISAR